MVKLALLAATILGGASAALAADLPVRAPAPAPIMVAPVYNWSGFYIGLNAGGAWGSGCTNYSPFYGDERVLDWPTTCSGGGDGHFTGGAQIGWNFQSGNFVYGVEADLNGFGSSGSSYREFAYGGPIINDGSNPTWRVRGLGDPGLFGTVRARLGYAADRALFYVTGGLAWSNGSDDPSISYWDAGNTVDAPDLIWRRGGSNSVGWTLGAGIEYALSNNWTVRGEYLYVDLGKEDGSWNCSTINNFSCNGNNGSLRWDGRGDVNFSVLRLGVNYKFGGGYTAPVVARY